MRTQDGFSAEGTASARITKVGVVGAGLMGRGVSQALAQTGHQVVLLDLTDAALDQARTAIAQGLRLDALYDRDLRQANHEAILSRVRTTTDYQELAEADFVIENATEDWATKEAIYRTLARVCAAECVLAANTSAIQIARFASVTDHPERVLGMHFMNPAARKPMVEVIRGAQTSDRTLSAARTLLDQLGKRAIVVGDSPGFVTNRILMLTVNEAIAVVADGIATPKDVDALFVGCFAHAMGPLATADLIGLDTILLSLEVLRDSFDDPKFEPNPLLRAMVKRRRLGRKSGLGFFEYGARGQVQ